MHKKISLHVKLVMCNSVNNTFKTNPLKATKTMYIKGYNNAAFGFVFSKFLDALAIPFKNFK